MPWNDNVRPGPWGSSPEGGGPTGGSEGGDDGERGPDKPPLEGAEGGPPSPWGAQPSGDRPPSGPTGPKRPTNRPTPLGGVNGLRGRGPRPLGGGGGGRGPEMEALTREWSERARKFFRDPKDGGIRPGALAVLGGIAVGLWALSGVYIVQPNEQAVVTRFGVYARSEAPGLKVRLPWPIEHAQTVPVTTLNQLNLGGAGQADRPEESLMLTGDENIIDMDFTVTWRVARPADYLFAVSNPDETVKSVAESAMREVVGRSQLNDVLSSGRGRIQIQAEQLMQRVLDNYRTGVRVVDVQIRAAEPPRDVISSFRQVASAGQEAQAAINEANAYRNRVVNEAVGSAAAIRQTAEGYRQQVVSQAEGEAARFSQVQAQYSANPGVTRERLYLETMERVLRDSNKVVVDTGGGANAPIILPPEVFRRSQTAPTPQTPTQPQASAVAPGAAR